MLKGKSLGVACIGEAMLCTIHCSDLLESLKSSNKNHVQPSTSPSMRQVSVAIMFLALVLLCCGWVGVVAEKEHTKNQENSGKDRCDTKDKHEKGKARKEKDQARKKSGKGR